MSSSSFVDLTHIPQRDIIQNMKLEPLWRMSALSKKTYQIISTIDIPVRLKVYIISNNIRITLRKDNGDWLLIRVCSESRYRSDLDTNEWIGPHGYRSIGCVDVEEASYVVFPQDEPFSNVCDRVVGSVLKLFRKIEHIELNITDFQQGVSVWKHGKKVDELTVSSIGKKRLKPGEIKFLLGKLPVGQLYCSSRVRKGFEYKDGFTADDVRISLATWVHLDAVVNSSSETIQLNGPKPPPASELNALLKKLLAMEKMKNLKRLVLDYTEFPTGFQEKVLEGISHNPQEVNANSRTAPGVFIRKADGRRARVDVTRTKFVLQLI